MTTEPLYQRLYVGSLHFSLTDDDVRQIFEPFGALDFVNLHKGRFSYSFVVVYVNLTIICTLRSRDWKIKRIWFYSIQKQ